MFDLEMWKTTRIILAKMVDKLSDEELLLAPEGFNNSMLWNLGHILNIQQVLHYKLCSLEVPMDKSQMNFFTQGSSPTQWSGTPDIKYLRSFILESLNQTLDDRVNQKFKTFKPFSTSTGVVISDFESCLAFNFFHEGLHTGYMMAQRKAIRIT